MTPSQCHLLDKLPSELRLNIYEHVYEKSIHRVLNLTSTLRVLQVKVPTTVSTRNYAALLRTCKTIYEEAMPCLYGNFRFSMFVYALSREQNYNVIGPLASCSLLCFAQEIHFVFWDVSLPTVNVFLLQARGLAAALKGNETLRTCTVRFHPPIGMVDREASKVVRRRCEEAINSIHSSEEARTTSEQLYRKILDEIKPATR